MISASQASAQSPSNIINLFNGLIGTAVTQAAISEWRKLRPDEMQCIDQRLRQGGSSIEATIRQGITPSDPRLVAVRRECRTDVAQTSPSFDCSRATLPDERAICTDPELARLDRLMASGYSYVRNQKGEQVARTLGSQLLRYRRACGEHVDCIREAQLSAIKVYRENGAPIEPTEAISQQPAPSIYSVDSFAVGSNVSQSTAALAEFSCKRSDQFVSFTACERKKAEAVQRGKFISTYALLHAEDGRVALASRALEPAWFAGDEAKEDIARLAKRHRQQPAVLKMPENQERLEGMIAAWGDVSLRPLPADRREALLNGREVRLSIWVDFLGDLFRSLQLGLPVYELSGNAGFLWAASWNGAGVGVLRFIAVDPSVLNNVVLATKLDTSAAKTQELRRKFQELLEKAKYGDVDAARAVFEAYLNGTGVEKNSAEANRWLKVLAEKGDARAETQLASLMLEGNGVPKDQKAALELFKKAAEKNDPEAAYTVGRLYDRGNNVDVNSAEAFAWFEKAAALGSSAARDRIDEGQKLAEAARVARNKLDGALNSIRAEELRRRVLDQSIALASANPRMSYGELVKTRQAIEAANRQIAELDDFDRVSALANSLVNEVEGELRKITSDAPLINELRLDITEVQKAVGTQDLASLQSALGNLNRLYKGNLARLRAMEFEAP